MKTKFLLMLIAAFTFTASTLTAQDHNAEWNQIKNRFETQKQTILNAYKADMTALKSQTNLTPAQKKVQEQQIKARYQQQRRTNQATFESEKKAYELRRKQLKGNEHKDKDSKPRKHPKAAKHEKHSKK